MANNLVSQSSNITQSERKPLKIEAVKATHSRLEEGRRWDIKKIPFGVLTQKGRARLQEELVHLEREMQFDQDSAILAVNAFIEGLPNFGKDEFAQRATSRQYMIAVEPDEKLSGFGTKYIVKAIKSIIRSGKDKPSDLHKACLDEVKEDIILSRMIKDILYAEEMPAPEYISPEKRASLTFAIKPMSEPNHQDFEAAKAATISQAVGVA